MVHSNSKTIYHNQVLPNIRNRHLKVMNAIFELGEATSYDVADYLNVPVHSISGRFSELSGKGKENTYDKPQIEQCGIRPNKYGQTCTLWRIKVYDEKPLEQANLFQ